MIRMRLIRYSEIEAEGNIRKVEVCGSSYFWLEVEQEPEAKL